jgi:hypothetical protein
MYVYNSHNISIEFGKLRTERYLYTKRAAKQRKENGDGRMTPKTWSNATPSLIRKMTHEIMSQPTGIPQLRKKIGIQLSELSSESWCGIDWARSVPVDTYRAEARDRLGLESSQ